MDGEFEKLEEKAGNNHKYQYFCLIFGLIIYGSNFIGIVNFPYYQRMPEIEYKAKDSSKIYNETLTYDLCKNKSIIIIKKYPYKYSWVSEFNIECDQFKVGLLSIIGHSGIFTGTLMFQNLNNYLGRRLSIMIGLLGFSLFTILTTFAFNLTMLYI